jgi:DNA-binding SARP family transcriptional activator
MSTTIRADLAGAATAHKICAAEAGTFLALGSPVRIHLRGELRLEVGGSRLEGRLPGRLGRALLAYLVLNRHRPATRDELVHALWPSTTPRDPAATLSTLLSSLRRALGPELVRGRSELQLDLPADAAVDVDQAAAALEAARSALGEDPELACSSAQAALDIYELPLVPTFDAPWLEEKRREQEEERLEALELLAEASLALGGEGPLRAQLAARQLVELAPFRESGHALLMRAHAARGNQAEALQAFERLRVLLREELGSAPSAELRALHEQVLAGTGEPARGQLRLPSALAKIDGRPFVGRESAMAQLRDALAAAELGNRRFVLTAGEPGIGKTSLSAAFAGEAHRAGAIVLYGRCDEEALVPYQPFVDVISHLVLNGQIDQLGASLRFELEELGRLVPELRRHMPPTREPSGGLPETERYRLFEAVVTTLARVAGDGTLVLVFDDVHWADRPTLLLLRHLARAAEPRRLLVLGAYRDVEVGADSALAEVIADVRRESSLELLTLSGLDEQETGALIEAHQGSAPAPGLAQRLHELTGGNPFFLEESLRAAGDLDGVPAGVREVVLRRVARLGPQATEVLGLAAVMGVSFPVAAVAPAGGFVREEVTDVLDRAVAARLLTPVDRTGRASFAHALIRRTLHDELGAVARAHLHELVAETLERHRSELRPHPAELSHHFYEARHSLGAQPALRYAREAADSAARSLAWEEAAMQLERALELEELPEPSDHDGRCELLLRLGEMRLRAGHPGFSDAFAQAAELARGRSSMQLALAAVGYAGRYYEAGVVDPKLIQLLREALAELGQDDHDLRARLLARLAEILHFAGEEEDSLALAQEAVQLAHDLGDNHVLADALAGSHVSMLHIRHLADRLVVSDEMVRMSRQMRDRERTLQGLQARIFDLIQAGEIAEARDAHAELSRLAQEVRQPLFTHFAVAWSAAFAQMEGRLEEAEALAAESAEMRRRMETADAESVFAAQLFLIRLGQGRVRELVPAVEQFVDAYPALAAWRAALPLAYLADGREADSARELERAVTGLDAVPQDFFWLATVGLLAEASGKLRDARSAAVLYEALAPYGDCIVQVGYAGALGPVERLLGVLAAARGDRDAAVAHLERALARASTTGLRLYETQARTELDELSTPSE